MQIHPGRPSAASVTWSRRVSAVDEEVVLVLVEEQDWWT